MYQSNIRIVKSRNRIRTAVAYIYHLREPEELKVSPWRGMVFYGQVRGDGAEDGSDA